MAKERPSIKNTRNFKRIGAKKIAALYQRLAAKLLHLDEISALGQHLSFGNPVAVRVRVRTVETFNAQVRVIRDQHEIL